MNAASSAYSADRQRLGKPDTGWRLRMYTIIFEADTPAGRWFDLTLIGMILASVAVVVLDSMARIYDIGAVFPKGTSSIRRAAAPDSNFAW